MEELLSINELLHNKDRQVTVLTGAGISAESGIPTFRGPEGYWTVGSKVYMPEEIATFAKFERYPKEVWQWYLYRRGICLNAEPNAGHQALVEMEEILGDRFTLITQNIDSLHLRAGNSLQRTWQIHGNINFTRCRSVCSKYLYPLSKELKSDGHKLGDQDIRLLKCPKCGDWLRPHVLFFDEYYDEELFYYGRCMTVSARTDVLIVVGTTGATNLPNRIVRTVALNDKMIFDINIEENAFSEPARNSKGGMSIRESASTALPRLVKACGIG